ncbi:MAG TPA: DUF4982 domain-containing protein [Thermoanaerobaculia bacterium]|nr:DUF4982 domain-containing protein [Thermoanaerobaculia bacterium]
MPAQIVFLTLYLGLIGGQQPVQVQVGADVHSVRFLLDGRDVGVLKSEPWTLIVDFGPPFEPHELVAVAYDKDGDENGRVSQLINLPRPAAELTMDLQSDKNGTPVSVSLRWEQAYAAKPVLTTITVDGKPIHVDPGYRAQVPKLNAANPHVIAAQMRFSDLSLARQEMVITGGAVSDSISTELTPVVITGNLRGKNATLERCLSSNGVPLHTRAVETPEAEVFLIREPNAREFTAAIDPEHLKDRSWQATLKARKAMPLDPGSRLRYTWPIVRRYQSPGHITSNIFDISEELLSKDVGMTGVLTLSYDATAATFPLRPVEPNSQRRFADAVAVAALRAVTDGRRRAIVLVVDCTFDLGRDRSIAEPEAVRRYLKLVGVPFFVWSVSGPRPDLEQEWGDIDDISNPGQYETAVRRLRASLASQHVAWVAANPVRALAAEADPRCGITTLAQLGR